MKEFKNKSGIYKITNIINNKVYIGKTKDFYKRYCQYVSDVRTESKNRINNYLMSSFMKYSFDNFKFEVIEFCSIDVISERELYWILYFDSTNREKGYNLRLDSSTGMIVHELTSKKISDRLKREWKEGTRSGHSDKLKESWEFRDREDQSRRLRNTLTKYQYKVTLPSGDIIVVKYKELVILGLGNVLASLHRKKSNSVKFKGHFIERIKLNESQT